VPWRKARFKGTEVLARCGPDGRFLAESGRVEIRYKSSDARAYRAALANLAPSGDGELLPDEACVPAAAPPERKKTAGKGAHQPAAAPDGAVIAYADGACSGNPGPAGIGLVMIDGAVRRELSEYLGEGTNNIAELTAILRALEVVTDRARALRLYTDSQYAIGVLTKGWKAKANVELVGKVRRKLAELADCKLHYVPGHSGVVLNERADALAVAAVEQRASTGWKEYGAG
jgi:ribonuclease HI